MPFPAHIGKFLVTSFSASFFLIETQLTSRIYSNTSSVLLCNHSPADLKLKAQRSQGVTGIAERMGKFPVSNVENKMNEPQVSK